MVRHIGCTVNIVEESESNLVTVNNNNNNNNNANPVPQSHIVVSGALLQLTLSSLATRRTAMKERSNQQNPKNTNEEQLFFETRNGNIRSSGKPSTAKAEEGYCNEATQSGPFPHNQSNQAQNTVEHTEVKQRRAWTKEEIREVKWCYILQTAFYRKLQESV